MADHDSTTHANTRMDGAHACIGAIRKIQEIGAQDDRKDTPEAFRAYDAAIRAAFLESAGPLPEYLTGFLSAVADYIGFCETYGVPSLDNWKPDLLKTEPERAEQEAELFPEHVGA